MLLVVIPGLTPGFQQLTLTNPDGETVSLDAALFANQPFFRGLFLPVAA